MYVEIVTGGVPLVNETMELGAEKRNSENSGELGGTQGNRGDSGELVWRRLRFRIVKAGTHIIFFARVTPSSAASGAGTLLISIFGLLK